MTFLSKLIPKGFKIAGYGARPRPARDWLILLALAALLLAASVLWNLWFFSLIVREGADVTTAPSADKLSGYPIGIVKEIFDARSAAEDEYLNGPRLVDPSR